MNLNNFIYEYLDVWGGWVGLVKYQLVKSFLWETEINWLIDALEQ